GVEQARQRPVADYQAVHGIRGLRRRGDGGEKLLVTVEKDRVPLADGRGSATRVRVCKYLPSRDRKGAEAASLFQQPARAVWRACIHANRNPVETIRRRR